VEKEIEKVAEIVKKYGAVDVRIAKDQAEADKYWTARKAGFAASYSKTPTVLSEDVTVPRGNIPALIRKVKEIGKKYNVENCVVGHAGDGNLHPCVLTDIKNKEHYERSVKAVDEIIEAAVELGGVLSGEHGIGLEKQKFFNKVTEPAVVDMMKNIKHLLDPANIMNPGKIWD
jgi:glycolate oxidase